MRLANAKSLTGDAKNGGSIDGSSSSDVEDIEVPADKTSSGAARAVASIVAGAAAARDGECNGEHCGGDRKIEHDDEHDHSEHDDDDGHAGCGGEGTSWCRSPFLHASNSADTELQPDTVVRPDTAVHTALQPHEARPTKKIFHEVLRAAELNAHQSPSAQGGTRWFAVDGTARQTRGGRGMASIYGWRMSLQVEWTGGWRLGRQLR